MNDANETPMVKLSKVSRHDCQYEALLDHSKVQITKLHGLIIKLVSNLDMLHLLYWPDHIHCYVSMQIITRGGYYIFGIRSILLFLFFPIQFIFHRHVRKQCDYGSSAEMVWRQWRHLGQGLCSSTTYQQQFWPNIHDTCLLCRQGLPKGTSQ